MNFLKKPRKKLGFLPTPVMKLENLTKFLSGPDIFIKRDDMTGLAFGGNKTRKLEYLIGDAIAKGCDTLITGGAAQSNHCRQTAAAAAICKLDCHLVLGGEEPKNINGNLLLDRLCGAEIHWSGSLRKGELIPELAEELKKKGRKPYIIPYGGSNPVGAIGYVRAVEELTEQSALLGLSFTHIVFPSSSGGTQAGLIVGAYLFDQTYKITGIAIDKNEAGELPFNEHILSLANETLTNLGHFDRFTPDDVFIENGYTGEGYGVVGALEKDAIELLARLEGILLDPVYTGRAMGALLDMIRHKGFSKKDNILFLHTGGLPAIFSYAEELTS